MWKLNNKKRAKGGCFRNPKHLALLLAFICAWSPLAQSASKITFNLKDAELETVVATVAEFTGKNFIIDPRVKGKVTVISAKPMSAEEVYQTFLSLLEVHNFAAVTVGNVIKIVPSVNAKQSGGAGTGGGKLNVSDEIVTHVIEIKHISASQLVPILRPLVPQQGHMAAYAPTNVLIVSDRSANVRRLMDIIDRIDVASATDIEVYALEHASAGEVVRILEALRNRAGKKDPTSVASDAVLVADERTNSILISGDKSDRLGIRALITHLDTPLETTGNTHVIYLRYAKAKDLVPVLTGLGETFEKEKTGGGKATPQSLRSPITIQAHEATNAMVITAPPDLFRSLQSVVRKLDVRRAQVLVEAVIAEVSSNRMAELGVQWLFDSTPGGNGPVGGTSFGSSSIVNVGAALSAGTPPPISAGAFFGLGRFDSNNINFAALINALEGDGKSNVLSKPTIVTLDNEEAEIVVGQNVPFITGSYTSTGAGSSTPSNPFSTIKRENVGITLKVKPQINEGDAVKLDIEQKVDSVAASSEGAADLITNTRSIKTVVMVDDGGAVILGGLITDDLQETEQKVPGLGDIPLLGALFRYRNTKKVKTNLMVFLHPVIMRDNATTSRLTASKYEFIRAQQLEVKERGIALMEDSVSPVMPTMDEFIELPPPFEPRRLEDSPADDEAKDSQSDTDGDGQ